MTRLKKNNFVELQDVFKKQLNEQEGKVVKTQGVKYDRFGKN